MRASNFYVGLGLVTLSGCLWFLACAPFDLAGPRLDRRRPMLLAVDRAPTYGRALFLGWWAGVVETGGRILLADRSRCSDLPASPGSRPLLVFFAVLRRARADFPVVHRRGLRHSPAARECPWRSRPAAHGRLRTRRAADIPLRPMDHRRPGIRWSFKSPSSPVPGASPRLLMAVNGALVRPRRRAAQGTLAAHRRSGGACGRAAFSARYACGRSTMLRQHAPSGSRSDWCSPTSHTAPTENYRPRRRVRELTALQEQSRRLQKLGAQTRGVERGKLPGRAAAGL